MDVSEDVTGTLRAQDHGHPPTVLAAGFCTEHSAKSRTIGYEEETSPTLRAGAAVYHASKNSHVTKFSDHPAVDTLVASEYKEPPVVSAEPYYIVRRLTPTECARLQGFPDWWCADVPHADSAEYKMWGNGVSLPCVLYVMEGIAKTLRKEEGEQNRIPDNSGNEGDNTA